jgi:5-methylcytosine-specific restriction endonuclease McrA
VSQTEIGAMKNGAKRVGISLEEYTLHRQQGQKWCYLCKAWRALQQFGSDRSQTDGHSSKCLECRRKRENKRPRGLFKQTETARAHIQEAWEQRRSAFVPPLKGKKHSEQTKEYMRGPRQHGNGRQGIKHTPKTRAKISQITRDRALRGEHSPSHKDGKVAERRGQRFSQGYKRWRYDVFLRDHFTCQECGDSRGGNLVAHHIKPFAEYPDLRFEVSNGLTLCEVCHAKKHKKGQNNG